MAILKAVKLAKMILILVNKNSCEWWLSGKK